VSVPVKCLINRANWFKAPHGIGNDEAFLGEIDLIERSDSCQAISGYQNCESLSSTDNSKLELTCPDIYRQFAPMGYASVANKVNDVIGRGIVFPAFEHSVFTTTEIHLVDTLSPAQKNLEAALDTMEAWTTIGKYDHKKGGGIILWDAKRMIEMPSGSTIVFPAGTKSFSWVGVAPNETRFLVR
jgi:hypothetical protein